MKRAILLLFMWSLGLMCKAQADPLPSWNEGPLKQSIINFVKDVATQGSSRFVPAADRIATFDNDGTLWAEQPIIQVLFIYYRVKEMAAKDAALKTKQPYKAILEQDKAYLSKMSEKEMIEVFVATNAGMASSEYEAEARKFFETTRHPILNVPIRQLVYQPQLELLNYLRANDFKVYICSGGTIEFIRMISWDYYKVPPEQVIGTRLKYVYRDSGIVNDIIIMPGLLSFNDKQEKPVNIQYIIGKRPIFACGNEGGGGDIYMLRFSQGGKYSSYQLIVNHDDRDREFFYQEKDNKSLDWAKKYNWHVVSMKDDWKVVFAR